MVLAWYTLEGSGGTLSQVRRLRGYKRVKRLHTKWQFWPVGSKKEKSIISLSWISHVLVLRLLIKQALPVVSRIPNWLLFFLGPVFQTHHADCDFHARWNQNEGDCKFRTPVKWATKGQDTRHFIATLKLRSRPYLNGLRSDGRISHLS